MDFKDVEPPDLRAFLEHLAYERRYSVNTLSAYQRDLVDLIQMLAVSGATLQSATYLDLRSAVIELRKRGLSASSTARNLSSWRAFYRYATQYRDYPQNPVQGIKAPKHRRPLPTVLTEDHCKALLDFPPAPATHAKLPLELLARDQAMFELLYSSGLRVSELASLGIPNLDLTVGEARVTGKGNKTRIVPVSKTACDAISKWYAYRIGIANEGEESVFVSAHGGGMTARNIELRLEKWSKDSGIGQHVHPHMLRHAFASHVLSASKDLRAVQEMLGHESISTTQIYTHLDWKHLAESYDRAHPRAQRIKTEKPTPSPHYNDDDGTAG